MQNDISKKNWILIWVLGMAGQICWNVENSWFSTFVYNKSLRSRYHQLDGRRQRRCNDVLHLSGRTWSDRIGRRSVRLHRVHLLGVFSIIFGLGEFMPKTPLVLVATFVVLADAIMAFRFVRL
jgi:hypothetical protein